MNQLVSLQYPWASQPVLVTRAGGRTTRGTCQKTFVGMSCCSREAATRRIITQKAPHINSLTRTKVDFCFTDSCLYSDKTDSFPCIQNLYVKGRLWVQQKSCGLISWELFRHLSCQIGLRNGRRKGLLIIQKPAMASHLNGDYSRMLFLPS